eukprot:snap_masked-scaffold_13-processed-gene-0.38-mRNA-1 protein AED:1.00 eAED:1.00 QI:0/-1/0/0/-1/1/1/0/278
MDFTRAMSEEPVPQRTTVNTADFAGVVEFEDTDEIQYDASRKEGNQRLKSDFFHLSISQIGGYADPLPEDEKRERRNRRRRNRVNLMSRYRKNRSRPQLAPTKNRQESNNQLADRLESTSTLLYMGNEPRQKRDSSFKPKIKKEPLKKTRTVRVLSFKRWSKTRNKYMNSTQLSDASDEDTQVDADEEAEDLQGVEDIVRKEKEEFNGETIVLEEHQRSYPTLRSESRKDKASLVLNMIKSLRGNESGRNANIRPSVINLQEKQLVEKLKGNFEHVSL